MNRDKIGRYKQTVPVYALNMWRSGGTTPLLTSALDRGGQPHTLATLLQGKCPWRMGGSDSRSGQIEE